MFCSSTNNSTQLQFFGATSLSLFTVASSLNGSFLGGFSGKERARSPFSGGLHLTCCACVHMLLLVGPLRQQEVKDGRTRARVRYKHTSGVECLYTLRLGQQNTTMGQSR